MRYCQQSHFLTLRKSAVSTFFNSFLFLFVPCNCARNSLPTPNIALLIRISKKRIYLSSLMCENCPKNMERDTRHNHTHKRAKMASYDVKFVDAGVGGAVLLVQDGNYLPCGKYSPRFCQGGTRMSPRLNKRLSTHVFDELMFAKDLIVFENKTV